MNKSMLASDKYLPYYLSLPALLALIGILYPFILGVYYTFTNYSLTAPDDMHFIGLKNYSAIFSDPRFWRSFEITLLYAFSAVIIELCLGLGVAMMLNHSFPGVQILRSLLIVPMMIPPIISALMWKVILLPTDQGVLNYLLSCIGMGQITWLGQPSTALLSLIIIDVWIFSPFAILIFLAGLQSLPKEPFEAAVVDGASGWFIFRRLTLPMLTPSIILITLFRLIDSLKIFDTIYATTKGGPAGATTTLHIQSYYEAIRWFNMGNGMVYLFVLWFLCFIFSRYLTRYWLRVTAQSYR
ncbi:MAG: sugar ABC transporter permease [Patescibacteria group bacterium]|nr:sugar ABC transporter permease [Patescibacteria group bacterium]